MAGRYWRENVGHYARHSKEHNLCWWDIFMYDLLGNFDKRSFYIGGSDMTPQFFKYELETNIYWVNW